jgi:sugar/nucleoside kinase (ribokinase family)
MIESGAIDLLIANEAEIKCLAEHDDLDAAIDHFAAKVKLLLVTCSEKGAIAVEDGRRVHVPAEPVENVVDTTGAGDLFAAGFLLGVARGEPVERSLRMGAVAAAEVISHFGARPEIDLQPLIANL